MIVVCPSCKGTGETGPFRKPPKYEPETATCATCEGHRVVHETTRTIYNTISDPYRYRLTKTDRTVDMDLSADCA